MSDASVLQVEQQGSVKYLYLNRPEKRNALSLALADGVIGAGSGKYKAGRSR